MDYRIRVFLRFFSPPFKPFSFGMRKFGTCTRWLSLLNDKASLSLSEFKGGISILFLPVRYAYSRERVQLLPSSFCVRKSHVLEISFASRSCLIVRVSFVFSIRKKKKKKEILADPPIRIISRFCPISFNYRFSSLSLFLYFFSFLSPIFPPKSLIPRQCYSEMAIFPAFLQNYTIYRVNIYRFRKYH